jgi:hypothetical protein
MLLFKTSWGKYIFDSVANYFFSAMNFNFICNEFDSSRSSKLTQELRSTSLKLLPKNTQGTSLRTMKRKYKRKSSLFGPINTYLP